MAKALRGQAAILAALETLETSIEERRDLLESNPPQYEAAEEYHGLRLDALDEIETARAELVATLEAYAELEPDA